MPEHDNKNVFRDHVIDALARIETSLEHLQVSHEEVASRVRTLEMAPRRTMQISAGLSGAISTLIAGLAEVVRRVHQ